MSSVRLRPPVLADAEAVLAVGVARDVADIGRPDYSLEDVLLDWQTPTIDPTTDCFVAEDAGGSVVGYAVVDHRGAMVLVHPQSEGRGVGTLLREAVEKRAGERGLPTRQGLAAGNAGGKAHLAAAGYRPVLVYLRLRGDLAGLSHAAPAAAVRRFDLEREGESVHALIEDAFTEIEGNVHEPFASWRESVVAKSAPALRLAVDDEGGLAGALVGEGRDDGVGYIADIAVARRARGHGYGRDLLHAAFQAFRQAGLTVAELSVQGANPAVGLYESVGLTLDWRSERWEKG